MMATSKIEWTESTWNPLSGCSKISPGCRHCYAERMAFRLKAMGNPNYKNGFDLTLHEHVLQYPLTLKTPKRIFVNSMSDLFHENVPLDFILKVFDVMRQADWHIFQILTKRSGRLLTLNKYLEWPSNVWMGVSVENQSYSPRIYHLSQCDAKIKFISFEPLLGPVHVFNTDHIDWVIVGGESGPHARPVKKSWILEIKDNCDRNQVPFFFKQWGGTNKKKNGNLLDGEHFMNYPSPCV